MWLPIIVYEHVLLICPLCSRANVLITLSKDCGSGLYFQGNLQHYGMSHVPFTGQIWLRIVVIVRFSDVFEGG